MRTRKVVRNGKEVTYYFCNYGIPDSWTYREGKFILFHREIDAYKHCYNIHLSEEEGNT